MVAHWQHGRDALLRIRATHGRDALLRVRRPYTRHGRAGARPSLLVSFGASHKTYLKITIVPSAATVRTHEVAVTVTRALRPFGSATASSSSVADASAFAEAESMEV